MPTEKRRWWLADARFARIHHRLRKNYRAALKREKAKMTLALDAAKEEHERQRKMLSDNYNRLSREQQEAGTKLAAQIARVRLEYGRANYGQRFTLYATMDEKFMIHATDLKEHAAYIIDYLAAMIKREFHQIDFTRMKPVVPRSFEEAKQGPRFYIDSSESLDSTGPR